MPFHSQIQPIRFHPILSSNALTSNTDPDNDISWRICLDTGSPSGLMLESTLGMQARLAQIFPVFLDANNLPIRDPRPTYQIIEILPDQIQVRVNLYPDMDVRLILRVPDPHTLFGETVITCNSSAEKKIQVGVCVRLNPQEGGQMMSSQQYHNQTILAGESGSVFPVLMSIGLPKLIHRPHPGLSVQLLVSARHPASYRWVFSAGKNSTESKETCTVTMKRSWAAIIKKATLWHQHQIISFQTGNTDLDEALFISQVQSQRLLHSPTGLFSNSFAATHREPEDGPLHQPSGTSSSNDPQSISAWELYHSIRNYYLPAFPEVASGMLQNLIESQRRNGEIDLRPGLNSQQSKLLAPPILASCCQMVYQHTQNRQFLADVYPALSAHIHRWIDSNHDLDQDRMPEWQSTEQTGWPDNPLYDPWTESAKGYTCKSIESPELGAYLYQECSTMMQFALALGKTEDHDHFQSIATEVKNQVEACWDTRKKIYRYRDRETHATPSGNVISRGTNAGTFAIDRSFPNPTRICLTIRLKQDLARPVTVQMIGIDQAGEHLVEQVSQNLLVWRDSRCTITSEHIFKHLESISLTGFNNRDEWSLHEMDLELLDLTQFLPLWAGIPTPENAARMVQFNLSPNWIEPSQYAIPMLQPAHHKPKANDHRDQIVPEKISFLIEGLIGYGFYTEANKLVNGLMEAIIKSNQTDGQMYQYYNAVTGQGSGRANHLVGLAPVGLYLQNLGIEIRSAHEIVTWGTSPYPQDIHIQYQGTQILRSERDIEVRFQDGEKIHLDGPEKRIIRWKSNGGGR